MLVELNRNLNDSEKTISDVTFSPADLAELVKMSTDGVVSKNAAKDILKIMFNNGGKPIDIAKENGFIMNNDTSGLEEIINKIIVENADSVESYKNGNQKIFGFLMGQVVRTAGKGANPKLAKDLLTEKLNKGGINMQKIDGSQLISEITLDDLQKAVGGSISFCACVHKLRKMSGFSFVILRTGRYILQSVYSKDKCTGDFDSLCEGAYIKITGDVKEEKRANHGYEITLSSFEILSKPAEEYPLHVSSKKLGCSIETSMAHRSVALRHPEQRAVFKIAEGVVSAFREFMLNNNFTEIHSPKIVAAGAEGGANIFKLKYFDKDAYLAQSPQFYKQTCVAFFDRVFEIAPVYRAEKHNSTRHLNEYIGLDFEMGFINDMHDVMAMETAMLKYVVEYLPKHYSDELELLGATLPVINEIPSVTFFEALDILGKSHNQFDLDPTDEVKLCEYAKKEL